MSHRHPPHAEPTPTRAFSDGRRAILSLALAAIASTAWAVSPTPATWEGHSVFVPSRPVASAGASPSSQREPRTAAVSMPDAPPVTPVTPASIGASQLPPPNLLPPEQPNPPAGISEEIQPRPRRALPSLAESEPISSLSIDIRAKPKGGRIEVPRSAAAIHFADQPVIRYGAPSEQDYFGLAGHTSADFCYRPLYFEEVNLERYGRTWGVLQPAASGIHFFATIPALPYMATVYRPHVCYDWNWPYEAGRPAPHVRELPPLRVDAGMVEAATIMGLILLFP